MTIFVRNMVQTKKKAVKKPNELTFSLSATFTSFCCNF